MRDRLIELISQIQYMGGLESRLAEHLLVNGVIVPPCKVGDTIYRIDSKPKKCSCFNVYTRNEYYCADELNCYLYGTPCCDCGEEAYIFTIPNADLKAIVCNMDKLGETVFLTKEEAKAKLKELGK